jgi:hypothetical protein
VISEGMSSDYSNPNNPMTYFDISVGGNEIGRITMEVGNSLFFFNIH